MKKCLVILVSLLLFLNLGSCATKNTNAQELSGSSAGKGGKIEVKVNVKDNALEKIEVVSHHETKPISSAMEMMAKEMIAKNTPNVDGVTGATITSAGFRLAVLDALKNGGIKAEDLKAKESTKEEAKDIEEYYDVVVIGAGGAGLVSAITAAKKGVKVAIMEKLKMAAGNTLLSGAEYAAAGNWLQKKEGIEDSPEQMKADMLKGGDNEGDPELVDIIAKQATAGAEWLKEEVGVTWTDELMHFGGHSITRSLVPLGATGEELIGKLLKKALDVGVKIYYDTTAKQITRNKDGEIESVIGENSSGNGAKVELHAHNGVIIATGGFGSNIEMREKYNPEMGKAYKSTDSVADVGEGLTMAQELGAQLEDMSFIQTYPMCDPLSGGLLYVDDARLFGFTFIVNKEGKRFVDELGRRDIMSKAILNQTDGVCYEVIDSDGFDKAGIIKNHGGEVEYLLANKQLVKADTLKEAADFFGIDAKQLQETMDTYNSYVDKQEDKDFNRRAMKSRVEKAPFYIVKATPAVHHTMGGIKINANAEVIDTNGNIIRKLYAAGEVTGNIHGTNRLGSCAIADLTVFGRIAGNNAATNTKGVN